MNIANTIARLVQRQRRVARRKPAKRTTLARYGQGTSTKLVECIIYDDGTQRTVIRHPHSR